MWLVLQRKQDKENKMSLYSRTHQTQSWMNKGTPQMGGTESTFCLVPSAAKKKVPKKAEFARHEEFKVRQSWSRVKFKSRYAALRSVTSVHMGSGIVSCACGSALNPPSVTSSKEQVSKLHPHSRKPHYTDALVSVWCMLCAWVMLDACGFISVWGSVYVWVCVSNSYWLICSSHSGSLSQPSQANDLQEPLQCRAKA